MGFPCKRVRHKSKHNQQESTALTNHVNRSPNHDIISVFLQNTNQRYIKSPNVNQYNKRETNSKTTNRNSNSDTDTHDNYYGGNCGSCEHDDGDESNITYKQCYNNDDYGKHTDSNRQQIVPSQRQKLLHCIRNSTISRLTQLISFKSFKHKNSRKTTSPPSSIHAATTAIAPTNTKINTTTNTNTNTNKNTNNNININNRSHNNENNNNSIITNSQYFIRQSVCLYAASGFLIALCYLAVPAAASIDSLHPM